VRFTFANSQIHKRYKKKVESIHGKLQTLTNAKEKGKKVREMEFDLGFN